ncbi:MAG: hypothetical protein ACOC86_03155 [Candidatus Bipolaricaulota bacterium]
MYYKAEFTVLGKPPTEDSITEAFAEDERITNPRAVMKEPARIELGEPTKIVDEPPKKGIGFDKMNYDGTFDPARGHLLFETPEEYVPNEIMDIFEAGMNKLNVPLDLIYIDANSEAFSDS